MPDLKKPSESHASVDQVAGAPDQASADPEAERLRAMMQAAIVVLQLGLAPWPPPEIARQLDSGRPK